MKYESTRTAIAHDRLNRTSSNKYEHAAKSLPNHRYTRRAVFPKSYIGKSANLLLGQTTLTYMSRLDFRDTLAGFTAAKHDRMKVEFINRTTDVDNLYSNIITVVRL
jgi:hypothetical protein